MHEEITKLLTERIIVDGDSINVQNAWPELLGIPPENNFAKWNDTAREIVSDPDNHIKPVVAAGDRRMLLVVSLGANDIKHAMMPEYADKFSESQLVSDFTTYLQIMTNVYANVVVLKYTDPFFKQDSRATVVVDMVNGILGGVIQDIDPDNVIRLSTSGFLDETCFDGKDIHPNELGNMRIASAVASIALNPRY